MLQPFVQEHFQDFLFLMHISSCNTINRHVVDYSAQHLSDLCKIKRGQNLTPFISLCMHEIRFLFR
ncbi:MAG: hypothetical protein K0R51_8 [Cytophagaceae bacterium]|jgi:hypothetical protein|nr:hypothetical protein [Cytophagaceae bacterium]